MVHRAYLLLGSNLSDRAVQLQTAERYINAGAGKVVQQSAVYETAAWGKTDQPAFLNKVICIETSLNPFELLDKLLGIEKKMGRERTERWASRIIDLDILFYDELVYADASLTIPHPGIATRRFTLIPLDEIAGTIIHPVYNKTIHELLLNCEDQATVKKISDTLYE